VRLRHQLLALAAALARPSILDYPFGA